MPVTTPIPRVLVVDDEESMRVFADRVLRDGGYDVVTAFGGLEVLQLVQQQRPFDVFVIDLIMPQMTGDELTRQLRRPDPDVQVLYFTGYRERWFAEKVTLCAN